MSNSALQHEFQVHIRFGSHPVRVYAVADSAHLMIRKNDMRFANYRCRVCASTTVYFEHYISQRTCVEHSAVSRYQIGIRRSDKLIVMSAPQHKARFTVGSSVCSDWGFKPAAAGVHHSRRWKREGGCTYLTGVMDAGTLLCPRHGLQNLSRGKYWPHSSRSMSISKGTKTDSPNSKDPMDSRQASAV
ncbi:hypothetical protein BDV95DRAFT_218362 [Massariosphaeria phaeospora]|uniref:Uncharacterized protein n=1 Tax=Massariosphaeria phaeospora TaxID=100035 RepID=A0A7C8ME62_9PLEO|nr:hypothetical protein BDV95DRAFT_218362 [Massariosphaeria phaeospora]